jgi:hypothetical protein
MHDSSLTKKHEQWVLNYIYECRPNELATRESSGVLTVGSSPDGMEPYKRAYISR